MIPTLKPHRSAFLLREIGFPAGLLTLGAAGAVTAGVLWTLPWMPFAAGGLWAVLTAWIIVRGGARYRKETYEMDADRIVIRQGGVMSDAELEVHYPNITHVKWIRPWLRHKLFGVGDVLIEVAGSGAGTIAFRDLAGSEAVQEQLRAHMRRDFSMSTARLLHEEQPAGAGILLDLLLKAGWAVMVLGFALASELGPLLALNRSGAATAVQEYAGWLLLIPPAAAVWMGMLVLRFLDLKRRRYLVYDGVIEYHEGFLTRNDAFMPVENLSNSEVTRGIAERVTGLYNVVVSCQGAGQEVSFLYLRHGPALDEVLDGLIASTEAPATQPEPGEEPAATGAADQPPPPGTAADPAGTESTFRMHPGRTLVPLGLYVFALPLMLLAPPLLLALMYGMGMQVVRMLRTTYSLRRNSVEEKFDFVNVKQREFTRDKLTGVVIRTNLWDRMFGTATIQFWSIGAGREITFRNVRRTEALVAGVFQRAGLRFDRPMEAIGAQFSVGRYFSASVPGLVLLLAGIGGAVIAASQVHAAFSLLATVLAMLPVWGLLRGLVYYPRCRLLLYEGCMVFQRGLLVYTETYARYENIKDITTVKYPGWDTGSMRFSVAGERIQEKSGQVGLPYGFTMHYVPGILRKDEFFDREILTQSRGPGTTAPERGEVVEARKALANSGVRTLVTSLLLFPLAPLLPLSLPLFLWRASLVRYRIEPDRVLMRKGKLYLVQTSILFDRIDHMQVSQRPLNKLFGNGNILISTAGSTRPELVLRDVKGHDAFYRELQRRNR